MKNVLIAAAMALVPSGVFAGTVDLSGWIENGFKGNNGAGTWGVEGADNDSVVQSINGQPTVFFEAGSNAQGNSLAGQITVETTGDDDFVGFVLGYQDGEMNSNSADFWLIDWKQGNQSGAARGLSLSHVSGDIANGGNADPVFWEHTGAVTEVQRAANLGDTGWNDLQTYDFELVFTETLIQVYVDGMLEIDYSSADNGSPFTDGAFGFYNYSQNAVRYAGITEDVVVPPSAVPLPASSLLLIGAFGGLGLMRRRRKS